MIYLDSAATTPNPYLNANASYAFTEKRLIAELDERVKKVLNVNNGIVAWGQNTTQLVKMLAATIREDIEASVYEHDCIADICGVGDVHAQMLVNNITGDYFVNACREWGLRHRKNERFFLMDCTAAIGHVALPRDLNDWCDIVVFSGHKFNGGFTAAMWMSERFCEQYMIDSADDVAGGTPDIIGRKQMVSALEEANRMADVRNERYHELAIYLGGELYDVFGGNMRFVCNGKNRAYAINAIRLNGINADTLQLFLASRGVYVGRGASACDSDKRDFRVLTQAYGLTEKEASEVIRVSFSATTTQHEIDELVANIKEFKERFCE